MPIKLLREICAIAPGPRAAETAVQTILNHLPLRGCAIVTKDGSATTAGHFEHKPQFCEYPTLTGARLAVPCLIDGIAMASIVCQGKEYIPPKLPELMEVVANLLAARIPMQSVAGTPPAMGFVGQSDALRQAREMIAIVAPAHTTVLLLGESGCGKELAARAIHRLGPNPDGPFIPLNCAALPDNLVESELFGHERGAFTGAAQMRRGRFELANGGTLFLDEIGELGAAMQAKLLRALQERAFERLGGMTTVRLDARIITATNRDLSAMVEAGTFRRDLFYRLNVFAIRLPPLRERPEDILPMAAYFLSRHSGSRKTAFSPVAAKMLQEHDWPGNARELENVMERAALLMGQGDLLLPEHLPENMRASHPEPETCLNLRERLEQIEREYIARAMSDCQGRIKKAAPLLGYTARQLANRLEKLGFSYKDFRTP